MKQKEQTKQGVFRLIELSGQTSNAMAGNVLLSSVGAVLQLAPYLAVYQVMAELLHQAADGGTPLHTVLMVRWAVYGLLGLIAGYGFTYAGGILAHNFAYRTLCGIRLNVAEHIGKLSLGFLNGNSVGKIKQVLDADVEQVEAFLAHQFPDLVSTLVMLAALFVTMFFLNVWMALACMVPIAAGFLFQFAVMMKIMKNGGLKENFDALEHISSSSLQYVKGMPSIKIFGQTVQSFRRFYQEIINYRDFATKMTEQVRPGYVRFRVLVLSTATFIVPVGLILFLRNPDDTAFAATFLFFLILGPGAAAPTLKLRSFAESMNTIKEGVSRVEEILNQPVLAEPSSPKTPTAHDVIFEHVHFSYDQSDPILKDVSFVARQGEITALVGPSGAGKSTIAELIPRFWDTVSGRILIGGVDIREIPVRNLMEQMSFVFQDSFLFSDTVYHNIALGSPSASKGEVIAAAKAAQCHDFVMALPKGYDTEIGENGVPLSGGEEQRVSIARAILKNAPILIMDEASAYADAENEHALQLALARLIENKTVIMVAHRLATICNANQILVVKDGKITECGTHSQLLNGHGLYSRMWETGMGASTWEIGTGMGADRS